jgi:predicted nucleotidyltransferase
MPDDLYHRDALAWSEQQAGLLRRVARGEQVNDIDWDHVVEEIEDVGLSELNAVRSYLSQILVHLLKVHGWPALEAEQHWRSEIVAFQGSLADRFAPTMRQRIDLASLYEQARRPVALITYGGTPARSSPTTCPVTLDQLLAAACEELERAFSADHASG